jgi:hypothetical protein
MKRRPTPALDELERLMQATGVNADLQHVATLVLTIFREQHPPSQPASLEQWIGQLAMDLQAARRG